MSGSSGAGSAAGLAGRVNQLEARMAALTEAVEVLARGLESTPLAEPANRHAEQAARRTHELLLLAKSAAPEGSPGRGGPGRGGRPGEDAPGEGSPGR
jgi:hypothetical protein